MGAAWESRKYELTFSTMGGNLISPPPYRFTLDRKVATGDTHFYVVTPDPANPTGSNPFAGCVLLPQNGERLIHYLPPGDRLDPNAAPATYKMALELLIDKVVGKHIDRDPDSYERLVGFISFQGKPVNPVTFYKVENTHKNGEVLIVVQLRLAGQSPGGSIGVIGR